ncbi:MAG: MBL fold metallo-hydrolase [Mogibacterium sp.]|nr:MBL fold metallo-hydrolase [Mogibacterium sp.]
MEIISVGSSSSGNSYIIREGRKALILDAGLSCIRITRALEELEIAKEDVSAILITHEHTDHIRCIKTLAKKCENASVYASRGTVDSCSIFDELGDERLRLLSAGEEISDEEIRIRAFPLSHDATEPIGFSIICGEEKLSVVTDTGMITEDIYQEISDATMLVIEANHDEHLLMYGDYPYHLKLRIKSDNGHLSNRAAGELLADLLRERFSSNAPCAPLPIMLAHLSFHNNSPFEARKTVEGILEEEGFIKDEHYTLSIAAKEGLKICGSK